MKEVVTKVIDTLTQEDFHGAFQKLLKRYKYIVAGGDYEKKSGNLSYAPHKYNSAKIVKHGEIF